MDKEEEISDGKTVAVHVNNTDCRCADCQGNRKYVTIVDIDRFMDSLSDRD